MRTKHIIWIIVMAVVVIGLLTALKDDAPGTKDDLIVVDSPRPNDTITSPLTISGRARGNWFFEASFPVRLVDANGQNIPLDPPYIMATGDWMTTEFVPFTATLNFTRPTTDTGTLILQKDNPSGLPENADELKIPVKF